MNRRTMTENGKIAAVGLGIAAALLAWPMASSGAVWAELARAPHAPGELRLLADRSAEQRDPDQEQSDRAQAARDREQAEQERLDRMQELYDEGRGYLDEESYGNAAKAFTTLAEMHGPQSDAALYWLAYAQTKQGKRDAALSTFAEVRKSYPQSRWK